MVLQDVLSCKVCGSHRLKYLFSGRNYLTFSQEKYPLFKCQNCSLVFLDLKLQTEKIIDWYCPEYFNPLDDEVRKALPRFLKIDKIKIVEKLKQPGKILDIGCGWGDFLVLLKERGWDVYGNELAQTAIEHTSAKISRAKVYQGDFMSVELPKDFFDVVTLWHVIEHLPGPLLALRKIHGILKKGGVLIIACPNFASFSSRFFKDKWYGLFSPYHLSQFSPCILEKILKKAGFSSVNHKSHFFDPFSDMVYFKESLLRFLGFAKMAGGFSSSAETVASITKRGITWRAARFLFNIFCLLVSISLNLLGIEETFLIWAFKDKK